MKKVSMKLKRFVCPALAFAMGAGILYGRPLNARAADHEARIGDVYYEDIESAFQNVQAGDTITVLRDLCRLPLWEAFPLYRLLPVKDHTGDEAKRIGQERRGFCAGRGQRKSNRTVHQRREDFGTDIEGDTGKSTGGYGAQFATTAA